MYGLDNGLKRCAVLLVALAAPAALVTFGVVACDDPPGPVPARRTVPAAGPPAVGSSDQAHAAGARAPATPGPAAGTGAGGVPGLDMRGTGARPSAGGASRPAPAAATAPAYRDPRTLPPPWIGGANAKVVIEEFTDFECPFCQRAYFTIKKLLAHYGGRIKLVFRHLPLSSIHPQARLAAEAAVCAQAQGKFWAMERMLFENRHALSKADILRYARRIGLDVGRFRQDLESGACKARVDRDLAEARKRQIEGTPCFFIGGVKHEGALPFARLRQLIDAELRQ